MEKHYTKECSIKQTSTIEISLVDWYPWNPLVILNSLTVKINIDI